MYQYIVGFLIIFVLHCNDVKISVVKISEIILIFYGAWNFFSFHKTTKRFFYLFTFFLLVTLIHNIFIKFDYSVVTNILQEPYWCSIGRYVELLCCLTFVELFINYIKIVGIEYSKTVLFRLNTIFCCCILFLYFLERTNMFTLFDVTLDSGRMTGFFNEGGPFGLLLSLQLVLSLIFKRPLLEIFILSICLFLSASKAGAMLLLICFVFFALNRCRDSKIWRYSMITLFVPFVAIVLYVGYVLIVSYGISWTDVEYAQKYAEMNPDDTSFVAGRVSGRYIAYEMFIKNPVIGVGLGNYPILRNIDEYRSFFPPIKLYDATGLGGIVDLFVQHGLLGIIMFVIVLWKVYKKSGTPIFIILFVITFCCGVQLTFIYPWILIAINDLVPRYKVIRIFRRLVPIYLKKATC